MASALSPVERSGAVACEDSTSSSPSEICGTDTTDVNVSVTGAWAISVSSAGTLDLDITPNSSGVLSTITDNLNVYTNTPNGYQLYLNSTSGNTDIYNNSDTTQELNHFTSTTGTKESPVALSNNTWGYSLATSPTTFSKVELTNTSADSLISSGTKTSGAGDDIPVTYGFKADTKLTPGTYTTQVTYTAIADTPGYNITSISPNSIKANQNDMNIVIITSTPDTELGLGDITAKIGTVDLTNCTEITNGGYRGATCTYSGGLIVGKYNIYLTSSWHNSTYTLSNAFTVINSTMQNFTNEDCTNLPISTDQVDNKISITDARDGKSYNISKMADGNCWMVQNLALDPGITLTPEDTNISEDWNFSSSYAIDGNSTTASVYTEPQVVSTFQDNEDAYGNKIGNYYNGLAASANIANRSYTGTLTQDICPKGWRLPDNGDTEGLKSYANLVSKYHLEDGTPLPSVNSEDASAYSERMPQSPLYFPFAGRYYSGMNYLNVGGVYLSRTTVPGQAQRLYTFGYTTSESTALYKSTFDPQNVRDNKSGAFNIRCVYEGQIDYIQDFTTTMCNNLAESTYQSDNRKMVVDRRDGKSYKIAKLADGNCWMVQNLALDGLDDNTRNTRTLTTADTNIDTTEIPSGYVILPSTIEDINSTAVGSYDTAGIYTVDQNKTQTNVDGEKMPYGNYYTWTALTALVGVKTTSGTVYSSLCPKGWHLPDNGVTAGLKSFSNLVSNYTTGVDGSGIQLSPTNIKSIDMVERIQRAPLFFTLAGRIIGSGMGWQNINGRLVSRTVDPNDTNQVYGIFYTTDSQQFSPQSVRNYKSYALNARCVFGD